MCNLTHAQPGIESAPSGPMRAPGGEGAAGAGPRRFAVVLSAMVAAVLAIVSLNVFATNPDRPVALIFRSGMTEEAMFQAIVNAGGRPIREGRSALMDAKVWLAQGESPDFPAAARAQGAWLVLNPYAVGGCLIRYD